MDGEINESVYNRFSMLGKGVGMKCGVVEWVKRSTLRCFQYMERMAESDLTKKVHASVVDAILPSTLNYYVCYFYSRSTKTPRRHKEI